MKKLYIIFIILFTTNAFAEIDSDIVGGCDTSIFNTNNNTITFRPVYTPKTYTCNSGYFLPANTLGCVACPNGYNCSGGTFAFNEQKSQGINIPAYITTNTNNVCSTNFLQSFNYTAKLFPIFRPKTVTLSFNDGNNTTSSTCTYDGLVNLPETPTRPGYDFNGWRIQTNN